MTLIIYSFVSVCIVLISMTVVACMHIRRMLRYATRAFIDSTSRVKRFALYLPLAFASVGQLLTYHPTIYIPTVEVGPDRTIFGIIIYRIPDYMTGPFFALGVYAIIVGIAIFYFSCWMIGTKISDVILERSRAVYAWARALDPLDKPIQPSCHCKACTLRWHLPPPEWCGAIAGLIVGMSIITLMTNLLS